MRTTNITFNNRMTMNLKENIPLQGASLEMNATGPKTKYFVIPNALATKLNIKTIRGIRTPAEVMPT